MNTTPTGSGSLNRYLADRLAEGTSIRAVVPRGAADSSEQIRAVVPADGENVNRELIDEGYGRYREDLGGAEARAMQGHLGKAMGTAAEALPPGAACVRRAAPAREPKEMAHAPAA